MQLGSIDHGITSTGVTISKRPLIPLMTELPCPPDTSSCRITCRCIRKEGAQIKHCLLQNLLMLLLSEYTKEGLSAVLFKQSSRQRCQYRTLTKQRTKYRQYITRYKTLKIDNKMYHFVAGKQLFSKSSLLFYHATCSIWFYNVEDTRIFLWYFCINTSHA